jgi:hypothetical protein
VPDSEYDIGLTYESISRPIQTAGYLVGPSILDSFL